MGNHSFKISNTCSLHLYQKFSWFHECVMWFIKLLFKCYIYCEHFVKLSS